MASATSVSAPPDACRCPANLPASNHALLWVAVALPTMGRPCATICVANERRMLMRPALLRDRRRAGNDFEARSHARLPTKLIDANVCSAAQQLSMKQKKKPPPAARDKRTRTVEAWCIFNRRIVQSCGFWVSRLQKAKGQVLATATPRAEREREGLGGGDVRSGSMPSPQQHRAASPVGTLRVVFFSTLPPLSCLLFPAPCLARTSPRLLLVCSSLLHAPVTSAGAAVATIISPRTMRVVQRPSTPSIDGSSRRVAASPVFVSPVGKASARSKDVLSMAAQGAQHIPVAPNWTRSRPFLSMVHLFEPRGMM